ncbi:MAG: radical SAM protein [Vulcanimicrobiota bacterium]
MYNIPHFVTQPDQVARLQAALDSGHSELLSSVKIKLTSFCNLRCQMCAYWKTKSEQSLSTDQWFDVLAQLADMGCRKVHFSGGEVFLRRDFLDLVEHGTALKLKINMTTNGTLLTDERLRRLIRARPNSISLSLDGPKAEIHDGIRGLPGSFKRTTRTLRKLNQLGERLGYRPKVRINSVLQRSNYKSAPQLVRLVSELGAVELHPMPVDEKGERKHRLSMTQLHAYNQDIAPRVLEERQKAGFSTAPWMVYPFGRTPEELENSRKGNYSLGLYTQKPCLSPWMHLFIGWDGETYLCCMTNRRMDSLGNVGRQSLQNIFNGPAMRAVRQRFLRLEMENSCRRCDMVSTENQMLHLALSGGA